MAGRPWSSVGTSSSSGAVMNAQASESSSAARFIVHPLLLWEDPADDERNRALARAFRADMRHWSTGATYPNFLGDEGSQRMRAAYRSSTERLAAVKAEWDPHSIFRTHQDIRGASGATTEAGAR